MDLTSAHGNAGMILFIGTFSVIVVILVGLLLVAVLGHRRRKTYERYPSISAVKRPVKPYRDDDVDSECGTGEIHYFLEAAKKVNEDEVAPNIMVSEPSIEDCLAASGTVTPISEGSPALSLQKLMGKLMVSAQYFSAKNRLEITVREVTNMANLDENSITNVRVALLPDLSEKSVEKFKTKHVKGKTPKWHETFTFTSIDQEQLSDKWIRLRLYRRLKGGDSKRDQLQGEALLRLCLIDGRTETCTNHLLNIGEARHSSLSPSTSDVNMNSRRGSMVDTSGRFCASPSGLTPELLVSLCYNDMSGKLIVGLEKGSCFAVHNKAPDTMVKVTVLSPYGDEIGKSKTPILKSNEHPQYGATFVFQVPYSELNYISVLIQIYCYLGVWRRRVLIGWLSLGQNNTSELEEDHWKQMISGMGISLSKWHALVEP